MGCAGSAQKEAHGDGDAAHEEGNEDYSPLTQDEIHSRIQCCDKTLHFKLKDSGITMRYGYLSQRGYYPEDLYKANQDAFKIIEKFNGNPNTLLFGVFDGHGADGDHCSYFVRDNIESHLKATMQRYENDFERAYKECFINCNEQLHGTDFDDTMSGTTAITAYFDGREVCVANIGDSRAVIGEQKGRRIIAYSLSIDQTPYRQDERERVKQAGAVIMSCDQLEGIVPFHENWGVNLGEELDDGGDPPRVWAPGKSFPGCAFTRSLGDSVAESIGVFAEPELLCKELTPDDKFIVIASDGVWEFLTNQSVADMILKFEEPLEACRAVVAESYRLWLQYEVRTDDITMILAFLKVGEESSAAVEAASEASVRRRKSSRRESRRGSASAVSVGADIVNKGENRPVRRGLSKEKRQAITQAADDPSLDDEDDGELEVFPKSPDEVKMIRAAVKANFLFQHLNTQQEHKVFDVMKRVAVKKGDVVIRQGDPGDWFYVVEAGEYKVTIKNAETDAEAEILRYNTKGGNPCFGELALMYSKPRAATVTAVSDGMLWAMDRKSFRSILMKSSSVSLTRTLRNVDVLKSMSVGQLQRLEDVLTEVTCVDGDYIIRQGEYSDTFYVLQSGRVVCTKRNNPDDASETEQELMELGAGQYFGERALLTNAPRAANVVARGPVKALYINRDAFEEVLGPLQAIIDEDRKWREKKARDKQMAAEKEGLVNVNLASFALHGVCAEPDWGQYVAALHNVKKQEYTIKACSKQHAVSSNLVAKVMCEKNLLCELATHNAFVPTSLAFFQDDSYLYTVYKLKITTTLAALLSQSVFDEVVAQFYIANALLALEHLHDEAILLRNLMPESLVVDANGYLQVMDLQHAVKLDGALPRDYCGLPQYLSPEQVSGQGHSVPADYWQLGVLMHEMLLGDSPFVIDQGNNSEVAIYTRISAHSYGAKGLIPADGDLSGEAKELIHALLHPDVNQRLGVTGRGPEAVRQHDWFVSFQFEQLRLGSAKAPYGVMGIIDAAGKKVAEAGAKAALPKNPYADKDKKFADFNLLLQKQ